MKHLCQLNLRGKYLGNVPATLCCKCYVVLIIDSNSCAALKVRCDGRPRKSCSRCTTSRQLCTYRDLVKDAIPDQSSLHAINPPQDTDENGIILVENTENRTEYTPPPTIIDTNDLTSAASALQNIANTNRIQPSSEYGAIPLHGLPILLLLIRI